MEIVYSTDFSLINLKVNRLIKSFKENVIKLSFVDNSWSQIETALTTINFISNQKRGVILEKALFLANNKAKLHETFHLKRFWSLISRLDPNLTLILTVISPKILTNWPKTFNPKIHQLKVLSRIQLRTYLNKKLKPQLEEIAIEYFLDNFTHGELNQINNEVEKINHLYDSNQLVTIDQLKSILAIPIIFDIFKMGSSFIDGNLNQFLQWWQHGFNYEANTQQLLGLLTKQLVTLRWYYHYHFLNLSDSEIASHLGVNPYYLKRLTTTNNHQVWEINDRISYIYNLNKKILLGIIDKKIIPEYLFLKMFPQLSERKNNGTN